MISDIFRDYIDNHEAGLGIIELPTSIGKTYSTFECIAQYCEEWTEYQRTHKRSGKFRQIIVVTTLKKNLVGLEDAYKRHNRSEFYQDEVMFLDNLREILKSNYPLLCGNERSVPVYITKLPQFQDLRSKVDLIIKGEQYQLPSELMNKLSLEANRVYLDLRNQIVSAFKKSRRIERKMTLTQVGDHDGYDWVFKLFPDLLIPRKKVLLMSFKKLLDGRMYEKPSCAFISDRFLKKKIIFIDEFDSTKQTIKDSLAEEQNENKVDFLQLYNAIYSGAKNRWSSDDLYGIDSQIKDGMFNLKKIIKDGEDLRRKYLLDHAYQTSDNLKDDSHTFIFKDAATRTISKDNANIQVVARDMGENKVGLSLRLREEMEEGDFYLDSVVRWVSGYLKAFASYAMSMAKGYEQQQNSVGGDAADSVLSTEEAFRTFLYQYGISRNEALINPQTKLLMKMADVSSVLSRKRLNSNRVGYDYYTQGFTYYSMEDGNHHNDNTIISMVDIPITAEGILAKMSTQALVLGLSATAGIPSVTGNYNLAWIADNIDNYHDLVEETPSLQQEVEEFLSERYKPYRDGRISVNIEVVDNIKENKPATFLRGVSKVNPCAALSSFSPKIAAGIESLLAGITDDYVRLRYFCLATVMRDFAQKKHLQSLLYLGSKNAEGNIDEPTPRCAFDKFIIRRITDAVNRDLELEGEDAIGVAYVYSADFDKTMNDIRCRLGDTDITGQPKSPERLVIISGYNSVGIGQNMQYPAPEKYRKELVPLIPRGSITDTTYRDKDIDAVYLGEITHLATVFGQDKITEKELVLSIFQAEELNANWEITPEQKEENIREAFKHLNETYSRKNIVRESESLQSELTRKVIQAVGRIGRSDQRCHEVKVYIDHTVLTGLHRGTMERRFCTPEMRKLTEKYGEVCNMRPDMEQQRILTGAATVSDLATEGIYKLLNSSKAVGWLDDDKAKWEEWRELVLKYPTATEEEYNSIPFLNAYYISNGGKPVDRYLFSANNRYYGHQHVWFGDKESFKNQPSKFGPFKEIGDSSEFSIMTMSEENAKLSTLLKYPGLRKWWTEKGYADHFAPNPYIVSPVLYTEILKGAYGEMAGRFIIWKEVRLHLIQIDHPRKYEVADFQIKDRTDEYVDFKYYSPATAKDYAEEIAWLNEKCDRLEASRLYVINIVKGGSKEMREKVDCVPGGRIVIVPWLIDEDGQPNPDIKEVFL